MRLADGWPEIQGFLRRKLLKLWELAQSNVHHKHCSTFIMELSSQKLGVFFSVKGGYKWVMGTIRSLVNKRNKQLSSMVLKIWLWGALKLTIFDEKLISGDPEPNSRESIWRPKVSCRPSFDCSFVHHVGRRLRNASASDGSYDK